MNQITESIMKSGFDGIIIVASNPVDLMTYVVAEVSGLPKNRVIGSGTVLDTARLRYLMADYLKISSKNIHAYYGRTWRLFICSMGSCICWM